MGITICVIGTFDTKGQEYQRLIHYIQEKGAAVITVDVGIEDQSSIQTDYWCGDMLKAAGMVYEEFRSSSRKEALETVSKYGIMLVNDLYKKKRIDGVICMGGSGGTAIGTAIMQTLPIGFPKVMVSTMAGSAKMSAYIDGTDIICINSIVDVAGINVVSDKIYALAAGSIVGAAAAMHAYSGHNDKSKPKPVILASMYGVTTQCLTVAKEYLEKNGYEVLVFHATGAGGKMLINMIDSGIAKGVLDVTLTEVGSYVVGASASSAGHRRLRAVVDSKIPTIVIPGALDIISVLPEEFHQKFPGHQQYSHNDRPSHIRTNIEDNAKIGDYIARELRPGGKKILVFLPMRGISMLDSEGKTTCDKQAREALFSAIESGLAGSEVVVIRAQNHINDEDFALLIAKTLHEKILLEHSKNCASCSDSNCN